MAKPLPLFKEHALRESAFKEGSTLCPGCMEAVTFHAVGRGTDNGRKTVFTLGTFCGEVSTLMYPNVVAWGRGEEEPNRVEKSVGVIHNVFESAPTVAEGVRDTASILEAVGAWQGPTPNVVSMAGDGGSLAIGLRSLLHAIHRKARITILVMINEVFANTGFQWSPASLPYADSATLPHGGPEDPLDHLGLAVVAGAAYVAQASPAFAPFFAEVIDEALATTEGTAVVFVPSPCITGWKFEDGQTNELAKLAAQTGLFPNFRKRRGQPGEIKNLPAPEKRPKVAEFVKAQRRFEHLVKVADGKVVAAPGEEAALEALQAFADRNVEKLARIAAL